MTRINVVPVEELSDQWLLAEYREFPENMAKDAEKYFGSQFCFNITNPDIKLLTAA